MSELEQLHKDGKIKEFSRGAQLATKIKKGGRPIQGLKSEEGYIKNQVEIDRRLAAYFNAIYEGDP